jgi:transposase InsO family protein
LIKALKNYLLNRELPTDTKCQNVVRNFANDCFVDNDIVWRRIKRQFEPSRVVIFLPQALVNDVLQEAHCHLLTGHDGVYKTKERIFQCYYWPGINANISDHLKTCHKCQIGRNDHRPAPALLTPLPQPTEPNQRIHADLFGPLRDLGRGKWYILTITDAFTKYVKLVSLPNKEAPTVCKDIFNRWICRYSVPLEIVTDQGGEFCNDLSAELYKLLQLTHLHTSFRLPACNSQAQVANKTIAKYLRNLVRDDTLDWEQYLDPLMFSYNTLFHRSIKTTPFFVTFGLKPQLPNFPGPDLRRKFYGESSSAELHQRLLYARDIARRNNENWTEENQENFNKKAKPHKYQVKQLVLLDEHSFFAQDHKTCSKMVRAPQNYSTQRPRQC